MCKFPAVSTANDCLDTALPYFIWQWTEHAQQDCRISRIFILVYGCRNHSQCLYPFLTVVLKTETVYCLKVLLCSPFRGYALTSPLLPPPPPPPKKKKKKKKKKPKKTPELL